MHLPRLGKYVTQQNLGKKNMVRKRRVNYIYINIKLFNTGCKNLYFKTNAVLGDEQMFAADDVKHISRK